HECPFVALARGGLAATRDQFARRQSPRSDGRSAGRADLVDSVPQRLDVLQLPIPETEPLHEHRAAEIVVPDFPVHLALFLDRAAGAEDLERRVGVGPEWHATGIADLLRDHAGADDSGAAA